MKLPEINFTKVISIDAATKSLAIACLNMYDIQQQRNLTAIIVNEIKEATDHDIIIELVNQLNILLTPIQIYSLDVVDLIPNEKVSDCSIIKRSSALVNFLSNFTNNLITNKWLDNNTHFIVEYQMGPNRKSGDIQTQLIYHFLQYLPPQNVHVVGPSLKNKLLYSKKVESCHSAHIAKYRTLYTANKSHTKYLFISWLAAHNQTQFIKNINKKNYADIADAFCQAAAYQLNGRFIAK